MMKASVLIALVLLAAPASAQSAAGPAKLESELAASLKPTTALRAEAAAARDEAIAAGFRYDAFSYAHRRATFERQGWMTVVVFVTVLVLVLAGLVFSAFQFWVGMRQGDRLRVRATAVPAEPQPTQLELSPTGMKISSPVLGVTILALSMGFFYLYLHYVYPITPVAQGS